jgi:gliding motility-associated-like protein
VSCSASVSTSNPSIADNCSLATLTWSLTGATTANSSATGINNLGTYTFNRGITTVTYTVTDAAGNSSNCSFTVTVTDNVAPIINCPANSTANAGAVACNASVATTNPTVSDNCGIATLTWTMSGATTGASPATGINNAGTQTFNIGVTTVTYVATDASGNSSNCSFTVTISDNLAPVFGTCPANMTANTTSSTCDSPVNTPAPVVTDNCSLATLTWALTGATTGNSPASGINNLGSHTFNLGTTTVTYTATDAAGNSSTCFYTVTITDAQAPVTPTLVNVLGQCSAVVLVPTTTDNCAGIIFGTTPDPLTYNAQGTYTVTWTFNDGNGNSTTATQTVIVDNNLPPVPPSLPDVVAQCDTTLTAPVSTTNCSGPVTGTTTDPTTYSTQGTYVVTWSFDDGTGNIVTATQNVIIDDVTPPVTPVLSAISDECSVTLTAPTTTDNCVGTVTATTSDPLVYNSQGTFTVNWTFDDNNGNTSTATQTVTINDVTPPTINGCPTNIAANNDPGQCTATVNWVAPLASDNCAGVTLTSTHTSGSTFPSGTTTVTYTATDAGGNTVSCSFDVTVTENEAPVIAGCPSNITTGNDAGDCGANVSWNAPTATDNCPGVTLTSTHNPGDAFPTGTTTVTYTATDAAGNTATCSFDVTVNDTENPVIAGCPSDIAIGNTTGNCDGIASWTVPTVSDNCPGVTLTGSHAPGDVFPLGTTTVTYTATDAAGNTSAICSFDVTVTDQEDPVIAGLGDLSICEGGTVTWAPFITDNCPGVTFTSTHNPGDVFQLGTTTVSYTATDAAGNTSSTSFNVDIYPLTPLVIEMNPTEVCAGEPLNLNSPNLPSNQGATYEWSLNGVVVSTDPNYNLSSTSLLDNGVYDLVVTQPGGCESYGQFTISLNPCDIIIPEALTPNGDGSNDLFAIENLENYPNSSVQIVNRWGNVVFESDDYKNDWDGTSYSNLNIGGNQLPEGTFYYVLTIGGETDTKLYGKVYTGYVYLKR